MRIARRPALPTLMLVLGLAWGLASALGPARPAHAGAESDASAGSAQSAGAMAKEIGTKAVDVFPIRFGGFLRTVAGGILLVPASLFSTFSLPFDRNPGVFRENVELLVLEPFDYTFRRPLGQDF